MKLYEIANQYEAVLSGLVDAETGVVDENALATLENLGVDVNEKAIAIASYIKNLDAERKAIEEAKKAMAAREGALANRVNYLNDYLRSNMVRCGVSEVSCPYFVIKLRKNPVSVDDFDPASIPDEYKKVITEVKIDKVKLKSDLQNGVVVPGASLKQTLRLEIK